MIQIYRPQEKKTPKFARSFSSPVHEDGRRFSFLLFAFMTRNAGSFNLDSRTTTAYRRNNVKYQQRKMSLELPRRRNSYRSLITPGTEEGFVIEIDPTITNEPFDPDYTCEIGENVVEECNTISGTESKLSATTNLAKCICGAGSFALPHVFLQEGIVGGTIALLGCGFLATYTMQSLSRSKELTGSASYVELAGDVLGPGAARLVFALTLSASLGVCSSYLVFIGQTLQSLSADAASSNLIRQFFPDVSTVTWETGVAVLLFPLCLLRSYAVFAFTSALGVVAVLGGIIVTLASGIFSDPGLGFIGSLSAIGEQRMFPESLGSAFGESFGTVAFLFCINFLTFPIMNSMKEPREYGEAIQTAVYGTAFFNIIFAILCVGFYGDNTADLVLSNLGNGPYLSALKLLLCIDLLFTFPIVFSSGRQIAEDALIGPTRSNGVIRYDDIDNKLALEKTAKIGNGSIAFARAGVAAGGILICFSLAQIGGFGTVANLVGGVAQGTLAFIMPPLITMNLVRNGYGELDVGGKPGQWVLGLFGVFVVTSTSYFTVVSFLSG